MIVTNGSGPALAASTVARSDGFGNDLVLTLGGTGTGQIDVVGFGDLTTVLAAGDVVQLSGNIQGSALTGITLVRFYIDFIIPGGTELQLEAIGAAGATPAWADNFDCVFKSVPWTVPAGVTLIRPQLTITVGTASSAVFKLGACAIRKVVA